MIIALFGASGGIGSQLLDLSLKNGDTVYAYVRNPSKIKISHSNLHVIQGTLNDEESMETVIANADIVFSALGPDMYGRKVTLPLL
jgi:Putative NADH-flavin reductase